MKKLSETVYRSPKWLQKYADFEFRTGEDIKGEPSEKQKEKIRKQKEEDRKVREEQERRERGEQDRKVREEQERRERENRDQERQKKRDEQERIERVLNDLFKRIIQDFQNNPWEDKFSTPKVGDKTTFKYRFENGCTFEVNDNQIVYSDGEYRRVYTVGLTWRNKFAQLANEIIVKGKRRPTSGRSSSGSSGSGQSGYQNKSEPFRESPKTGNPQRDKYNLINDKIKLREDQLRKMKSNDPDRTSLENELNSYKRVRDKMKNEHKFENLKTFEGFFDFLNKNI